MRKKIVAGNWKMNCTFDEACKLASEIITMVSDEVRNDVEIIVSPPFLYVHPVSRMTASSKVKVAAQNCSSEKSGAFTGEVSASMIASAGASYVIIGHSERRSYFNETNEMLSKKVNLALENKLTPIFCCGETKTERESNKQLEVVKSQLEQGIFHLDKEAFKNVIVAYEPVWAIGTGLTATPAQAQEIHACIRKLIADKYGKETADNTSILYGGSCNENNAKELFALVDVDGGLIGGASLKSRSFVTIIQSFS